MPAELTFIGTATTLLEIGPFMILTDPNFLHRGERAYLGYGLWSKRLTEPALTPAQLPPVDVIVLSHLHGDHWDRRSRHELSHDLPVVTTPHAARRLRSRQRFAAGSKASRIAISPTSESTSPPKRVAISTFSRSAS